MTAQHFSTRRRFTVLAALTFASWSMVAIAADLVTHLTR